MGHALAVLARRRRAFLLAGALVFCTLCAVAPHMMDLEYTATARVQPDAASGESTAELAVALADRGAVARAAVEAGLLPAFSEGTAAGQGPLDAIFLRLRVEPSAGLAGGSAVTVSWTHSEPEPAAALPNALIKQYLEKIHEARAERLAEQHEAAHGRVEQLKKELDRLTKRQIAFEAEHADLLPDRPGAIHQKIDHLREKLDELKSRRAAARQKLLRLQSLLDRPKSPDEGPRKIVMGPNPNLRRLREQLREAKAELEEALELRNMTETHPTVQRLRKKVAVIEKQIEQQPKETVVQRVYGPEEPDHTVALQVAAAQAEVDEATLEIERLESGLAEARRARIGFGPAREEYLALLKQIETREQDLQQAKQRFAAAKANIESAETRSPAALAAFRPADVPNRPSSPGLWSVLVAILAASLAAGTGAAAVAHWSDRRITTPRDAAERVDVPVLGTISEVTSLPRRFARWAGRWLLRPVLWLAVVAVTAMAVSHVVLWLRHPQVYREWKAHPPIYVYERLADWSDAAEWTER